METLNRLNLTDLITRLHVRAHAHTARTLANAHSHSRVRSRPPHTQRLHALAARLTSPSSASAPARPPRRPDDFLIRLGLRRLGSLHRRHLHDLVRDHESGCGHGTCDGPHSGSRSGSRTPARAPARAPNCHASVTLWVELRRRLCCSRRSVLRTSYPMQRT